jgi:hypothetical protein
MTDFYGNLDESPIRFLDIDVSRLIYEHYCPAETTLQDKRAKEWKNLLNDCFHYQHKGYLKYYNLPNIYGPLCMVFRDTGGRPYYGRRPALWHNTEHFSFNKYLLEKRKRKFKIDNKKSSIRVLHNKGRISHLRVVRDFHKIRMSRKRTFT